MSLPTNPNAPHRLSTELQACIERLQEISQPEEADFDQSSYGVSLHEAFSGLRAAAIRVVESSHINGLEKVGQIPDLLKGIALKRRSREADEIFWEQMSQHYQVKSSWDADFTNLTPALQMRLLKQMIQQEPEPARVMRDEVNRLGDDAFMEGLTLALKLIEPTEIRFDPSFYEVLFTLKRRLKPHFMPGAVEHIAAHKDLYLGFFSRLLKVATLPHIIKPKLGDDMAEMVNARKAYILDLMGYSKAEAIDLIESGSADDIVPSPASFQRMRNAMSLPAEFLALLYQAIPSKVIMDIAEIAIDDPIGRMPYVHFERMGLARSSEWHMHKQEKSGLGKSIVLFEHAIHTPGIEMCVSRIAHQPLLSDEPGLLERVESVLANVPTSDPECLRKGQLLFDALVENMNKGKSTPKLREIIESGTIQPAFYRKHRKLKVARVEHDLGI
ncbi:hypothetical protein [Pseudomonas putida]|uniref:Uncharacterized protein n=1 Tax=Pseudomonas putida TaxID=303 RepID=A0A8I1ECA8_PSEPU|nr:hypothetical protein [Pseudomonas putida]MBI6882658.1 hypothetical protein [Pseudomonas putida]